MSTYQRLNQIRKADVFDDTLTAAAIAAIESSAVDQEDFQGGMLSQFKRIIGGTDWFSSVQNAALEPRNLKTLTDDIYYKAKERWRTVLTGVTVGAGNNFVVLNAAGLETPTETAAVGAGSANGAIVALLAGASGTHSLNEVAGLNAIFPKNLVMVREVGNQDPILDSFGREVLGLLQAESVVVNGDTFDDTTKQAQISFVTRNATGDDLIAAPVAAIENKVIHYQYESRTQLYLSNEQDDLVQAFGDPQAATTTTLQQAYVAGNTISVITAEGNLIVNLSQDLTEFDIQRGGVSFATFKRDDTLGDALTLDADILDVNLTTPADFNTGVKVATGATTINLGVTAGQIDATALVLRATTGDATLHSNSGEVKYRDSRETTALPFTDASAGAISGLPGGPYASVSAAIKSALLSADLDIFMQTLAADYAQDANVPGSGNGNAQDWSPTLDLSARSIDANTPASVDTLILYNGRVCYGGNGTTNNDVYKGTTPANGDLKYDFLKGVKSGDWVMALSWKAA